MTYRSKRLLDIFFSLLILLVTFPILILFLILIIVIDRQFPIFVQERSGLKGKKIFIYKLKTIKNKNKNSKISFLGKFLRLSKIDELPQLINVLKNDLSLVGPRPLYLEYNKYLTKKHKKRLLTKPGITGLSQIRLKNSSDWIKKFDYDVFYVENLNLKLDLYIILNSFFIVLKLIFVQNQGNNKIIDYKIDFYKQYVDMVKKNNY